MRRAGGGLVHATGQQSHGVVPAARARLRRALVAVAAGDRPGIVARVFGGEGACHRGDQSDVAPKYNMQYPSQRYILPNTGGELRGVRPWTG